MKVFDLCCQHHHGFEGWFASEDDYVQQLARGLLTCPLCGDAQVTRRPSAPRLNVANLRHDKEAGRVSQGAPQAASAAAPSGSALAPTQAPGLPAGPHDKAMQALWMQAVRQVMAKTVDVGDRFAEEARRIHYGEAEERAIRGQASPDQAEALREEGIEVFSLPLPAALKEPLQ